MKEYPMATIEGELPMTLREQIAAWQAQAAKGRPPEVAGAFADSIAALAASGIAERALKVGERAPDFTLPNDLGGPVTLSRLLRQGPAVVTFYRGEWCPYCNLQLRAYQAILPRIRDTGATLVAISPQTPDQSFTTTGEKGVTFPVTSDAGNALARRYGLVFALAEALRPLYTRSGLALPTFNVDASWELPIPGTFIVAQDGTVRLAFVDADSNHRLAAGGVLAR